MELSGGVAALLFHWMKWLPFEIRSRVWGYTLPNPRVIIVRRYGVRSAGSVA